MQLYKKVKELNRILGNRRVIDPVTCKINGPWGARSLNSEGASVSRRLTFWDMGMA